VPGSLERALVAPYTDIQRTRFVERLITDIRIEPGLETAQVPFLLLQPLVENAIRHGLDLDAGSGRVEVLVERRDPRLRIVVEDTGGGHVNGAGGLGLGLGNVQGRLRALYGSAHTLRMDTSAAGTTIEIEIPLRFDDE
jgi:two-component system LytT family sensor kinase